MGPAYFQGQAVSFRAGPTVLTKKIVKKKGWMAWGKTTLKMYQQAI